MDWLEQLGPENPKMAPFVSEKQITQGSSVRKDKYLENAY